MVHVGSDEQWQAYHAIRRHVLFELRGHFNYDERHPDEYVEAHIPLLLLLGGIGVGTARLDMENDRTGVVRLVAILPEFQRQGLGRTLLGAIERLAAERGLVRLYVHAAPDAVGFYARMGWEMLDARRQDPLMSKELPSPVDPDAAMAP
jgi:N-acetylglutamate synthase-like GNAT family acetyltransferase